MKINKYLRNWLIYILILIIVFCIIGVASIIGDDKIQVMNNLDYNVTLNKDGSMNITETWDVYVKNTGTLFKDFYRTDKYPISDVTVKNLNTNTELEDLGREEYQVPEGMFYAEPINNRTVEVAFGTGKRESSGNVKYQISYKIENVITSYKDCQEFYWQFLDESNSMPCKKVTGTIKLPKEISNMDNLKIWGHGNINGDINKISADEVSFDVKNLDAENMLEVRVVTAEKMFNIQENEKNYRNLDNILEEEAKWSEETNQNIRNHRIFVLVLAIIEIIILILLIRKGIKYYKISKKEDDGIKKHKRFKYFRDIPREKSATPGEAEFLYNFSKNSLWANSHQSDVVAASILDLCLKGYITLEKREKKIYIAIAKTADGLKNDEKEIYNLIKDAIGKNESIEVGDLKKFAKEKYYKYSEYINKMANGIKKNLYEEGIVDKKEEKLYNGANSGIPIIISGILLPIIIYNAIGLIPIFSKFYIVAWGVDILGRFLDSVLLLLPVIILLILLDRISSKAKDKIYQLTQKGEDERADWKGLAKFLKDYSKIDEKGVFDIVLWEKYLVYATAFGISDKVIDELKATYPDVFTEEYWQEKQSTTGIIDMACNPIYIHTHCSFTDFTGSIQTSYRTMTSTVASHYSSSSGGGGGFSSGGGGRWWRWSEWEEDKLKRDLGNSTKIPLLLF